MDCLVFKPILRYLYDVFVVEGRMLMNGAARV